MIEYARMFEYGSVNKPLTTQRRRSMVAAMQTPDVKTVTRGQQLAEHHYDGDLPADVRDARNRGASWRIIAADVNARLSRRASVTHESLRQWYGDALPPSP